MNHVLRQGVRMEPIELGIEAETYRVNELQVIADAGNDRALSIGLLVVFPRGAAAISISEMAQGVEALARQAMARLEGSAAQ